MNSPISVITGASSGIGLELARLFAADGCPAG
jgi:NAD(P)-dependent dehydrogenase (short-subunit alcohol dehydrogenase family)